MAQMDAFTFLLKDHEKFRKLFKDYEALGDRALQVQASDRGRALR